MNPNHVILSMIALVVAIPLLVFAADRPEPLGPDPCAPAPTYWRVDGEIEKIEPFGDTTFRLVLVRAQIVVEAWCADPRGSLGCAGLEVGLEAEFSGEFLAEDSDLRGLLVTAITRRATDG